MSHVRFLLVLVCGVAPALACAQTEPRIDPDDPPVVGQPPHFWGAVGSRFVVTLHTQTTEVEVGSSLKLTVRVKADGPWKHPPQRPRLDTLKHFKERFQIDRPDRKTENKPDRMPDQQTWEFDYRLRPLSESVQRVPAVPFAYYKPSGNPNLPGTFPVTYAPEMPLTVKAKTAVAAKPPPPPIQAPPQVFSITEGPAVLQRDRPAGLPSTPWLILSLLLPPVAAVVLYRLWRRVFPDALRRASQHRSVAAKHALQALQAAGPADPEQKAHCVARITAGYLQQRLGLQTAEPTPAEVTAILERAGSPPVLAGKAAEFFRACDARRFAPARAGSADEDLTAAAARLILTLESESWSASPF